MKSVRCGAPVVAVCFCRTTALSTQDRLLADRPVHIQPLTNRRTLLQTLTSVVSALPLVAQASSNQVTEEELDALYDNPNIPQAPEEKSGLVVLRVAEVTQFQEQILRNVANGSLQGVSVAPMQFQFGTQILLRNSNLDGNMKLMIAQEVPRAKRVEARKRAARAMNGLLDILQYSSSIQRDFESEEMIALADMYRNVRVDLNELYEYLEPDEKAKYYGYFMKVTEYEKKIADGVYNPDIDGVLQFDD